MKSFAKVTTEALAKRILKLKDQTAPIYAEIDRLNTEMIDRCVASFGRRVGLLTDVEVKHKGEIYRLVDNFDGKKNVVYRPARVSRFELQRVPKPKPKKKLKP